MPLPPHLPPSSPPGTRLSLTGRLCSAGRLGLTTHAQLVGSDPSGGILGPEKGVEGVAKRRGSQPCGTVAAAAVVNQCSVWCITWLALSPVPSSPHTPHSQGDPLADRLKWNEASIGQVQTCILRIMSLGCVHM
ncbi:hypothetical protein ABBQ32_012716 [Trebouxia sp. C0010 RCD-2024]